LSEQVKAVGLGLLCNALILRSVAQRRVSKDGAELLAILRDTAFGGSSG
jgi:hypothetical protein